MTLNYHPDSDIATSCLRFCICQWLFHHVDIITIVIRRTLTDDNKVNTIDRSVGSSRKAGWLTACSHTPTNVADICRRHLNVADIFGEYEQPVRGTGVRQGLEDGSPGAELLSGVWRQSPCRAIIKGLNIVKIIWRLSPYNLLPITHQRFKLIL